MNMKLKAGLYTVGLVVGGYFALSLIHMVFEAMPESWRLNVFGGIIIVSLLYAVYNIVLTTLETDEKLKKIADRN